MIGKKTGEGKMIGIKPERAQREGFFGKLLLDLTIKKSCTYCENKNVPYIKIITIKFQINKGF